MRSDWRQNLPSWDSFAIPRQESDATKCRATNCPDTNWGGHDRIHLRGPECPPLEKAIALDPKVVEAAAARYENQHRNMLDKS